jgi:hypothetical protein
MSQMNFVLSFLISVTDEIKGLTSVRVARTAETSFLVAMWTLLLLAVTFALAVASYIQRYGKPANFPPG